MGNRTAFFTSIKSSVFRGKFSQSQVDGLNRLLDAMGGIDDSYKAYMLATAYHETAHTMQPITEYGGRRYFDKYEGRAGLGNIKQGDGYKYRGRGDVMITGRRNYTLFARLIGINLVDRPDLAKDPKTSARILIKGCVEGLFTGKKMSDYTDFVQMRRVVNGTDKAQLIAGYANSFLEALDTPDSLENVLVELNEEPTVTGKPVHKSTTNWAGGVAALSIASSASADVKSVIGNLGVDPKWILLGVGLAAIGWIVRERFLKKFQHGV